MVFTPRCCAAETVLPCDQEWLASVGQRDVAIVTTGALSQLPRVTILLTVLPDLSAHLQGLNTYQGWLAWKSALYFWEVRVYSLKRALYNAADKNYQQSLGRGKLEEWGPGTLGHDLMTVLH